VPKTSCLPLQLLQNVVASSTLARLTESGVAHTSFDQVSFVQGTFAAGLIRKKLVFQPSLNDGQNVLVRSNGALLPDEHALHSSQLGAADFAKVSSQGQGFDHASVL